MNRKWISSAGVVHDHSHVGTLVEPFAYRGESAA